MTVRVEYATYVTYLHHALHELPMGVLGHNDSATEAQCASLRAYLTEFEAFCREHEITGQEQFIEGCRWHFERYEQYLGRRRHFNGYEEFIRGRGGPLWVERPPSPW